MPTLWVIWAIEASWLMTAFPEHGTKARWFLRYYIAARCVLFSNVSRAEVELLLWLCAPPLPSRTPGARAQPAVGAEAELGLDTDRC